MCWSTASLASLRSEATVILYSKVDEIAMCGRHSVVAQRLGADSRTAAASSETKGRPCERPKSKEETPMEGASDLDHDRGACRARSHTVLDPRWLILPRFSSRSLPSLPQPIALGEFGTLGCIVGRHHWIVAR